MFRPVLRGRNSFVANAATSIRMPLDTMTDAVLLWKLNSFCTSGNAVALAQYLNAIARARAAAADIDGLLVTAALAMEAAAVSPLLGAIVDAGVPATTLLQPDGHRRAYPQLPGDVDAALFGSWTAMHFLACQAGTYMMGACSLASLAGYGRRMLDPEKFAAVWSVEDARGDTPARVAARYGNAVFAELCEAMQLPPAAESAPTPRKQPGRRAKTSERRAAFLSRD